VVKIHTYDELIVDVNLFPCMMKQQRTFLSCCVDDHDIVGALLSWQNLEWARRAMITSSADILFENTTLECLRHSTFFSFTSLCSFNKICIGTLLWRLFSWHQMGGGGLAKLESCLSGLSDQSRVTPCKAPVANYLAIGWSWPAIGQSGSELGFWWSARILLRGGFTWYSRSLLVLHAQVVQVTCMWTSIKCLTNRII
jgi:hypothetical protein